MGSYRTTSLTLVVTGDALPQGVAATLGSDSLFHRPSGVVADMGGDPLGWLCVSKHVRDHFADHDVTGFRTVKGGSSAARLRALPDYQGSGVAPLGAWLARMRKDGSPHPLVAGLGDVTGESITAAYAAYRAEVDGQAQADA